TIRVTVFFFFQAEDGIRDLYVTGVQTCALPISGPSTIDSFAHAPFICNWLIDDGPGGWAAAVNRCLARRMPELDTIIVDDDVERSEERRVGKECRFRGWR